MIYHLHVVNRLMQLKAKYVKLSGVDLKPAFTVSEVLEKLI